MANAGIYSQIQVPQPANALQDYGQLSQLMGAQQNQQLNALKVQGAQRDLADDQTTRALATQYGNDATGFRNALMSNGLVTKAQALDKQNADIAKSSADADKAKMDAISKRVDIVGQAYGALRQNPTLETGTAVVQHLVDQGIYSPQQGQTFIAKMTANPEQIAANADIAFRAAVDAKDQLVKTSTVNTGNQQQFMAADPVTGKSTVMGTTAIQQSPDNVATNAAHIQSANISANASRANNRDTIAKDYAVAGLNTDGTPGTSNDAMIDAIGQYKVQPPNGMALRNPRMQQILADVTAKYPDFDATQYGARQQAAKSFSTGKDGQAVQSANTALNHLQTLKELADAQNNGDIRLYNSIANRLSAETGGTAPTNLAAAVTMVGPEISKAVIGAGGGQGDREKVDEALAALTKGGKAQAAGTIATMQDLFGGRLTEAQRTYERTTGRKDFSDNMLSPAAQQILSSRKAATTPAAPGASKVVKFGDLK